MAIRNTTRRNFRNINNRRNVKPSNNKQSWGQIRDYSLGISDSDFEVSKKRNLSTIKNSKIDVEYFSDGTKRMRWSNNKNDNVNKSNTTFPIQKRLRNRR